MTFDLDYLFAVAVVYLLTLFLIAYAAERGWVPGRIIHHPITYALSLGVYCTSWSYYGSVGFAEQQGFLYLTIYFGPTLAFILAPLILVPILRLIRDYQLTSLADLFAFRYSSQLAGILVTLFMLVGTLPYIALQIRAVSESIRLLTQDAATLELGLMFCLILTLFAILFGARHISPREKHEGLVLAIAFESLVKLGAILIIGGFALFGVFNGPSGLEQWLQQNPQALQALYEPVGQSPWASLILLSFAAAFLLPRQFHMVFIENLSSRSLIHASWMFPLFLLLFNLAIPPILWAGQALSTTTSADYYTLGITLSSNNTLLPIIAFIGGISAASAMVIVTTLALSQMALNHLLLPASYPDPELDMYGWLIWGRRMLIIGIIMVSYFLYLILERNTGLVQLGLVSFVAVAQFLPGLIGVLFWQRASRAGFLAGLLGGALVWYLSLIEPLLVNSGIFQHAVDLSSLLGLDEQNIWAFSTFWSLAANTSVFVLVSLITQQDADERRAVAACFQDNPLLPDSHLLSVLTPQQWITQLAGIIGETTSRNEVEKALADLNMSEHEQRPHELYRLRDRIERNLSGMLGPMLARMIVASPPDDTVSANHMLADHIRFIEERLEQSRNRLYGLTAELDSLRRYHRQILQDLPLGACSLARDGEILNWNQAMEQLSSIDRYHAIGTSVAQLPDPWGSLLADFVNGKQQHLRKIQIPIQNRVRWFNLHKAAIAAASQPSKALVPASNPESQAMWGGIVILIEDLTDLQTLEAELAHSERLASIGRLAAGVAHEIGNPTTGIACIAQNLRYEEEPEVIEQNLSDILQQTERINTIVQSLVTFSHSGLPEPRANSRFNLYDCVHEAQRLVKLSQNTKQLHYINRCPDTYEIEGDRQKLLQVFVNLLNNAGDASKSDDRIEIDAELQSNTDQPMIAIRVSDQGEGIPEELRERVFEPFFTTKDPGEGTGLGLPLVYNIIRDHNGTISIEENPEGGTRILIQLPLTPAVDIAMPEAATQDYIV